MASHVVHRRAADSHGHQTNGGSGSVSCKIIKHGAILHNRG